MKNKIQINKLLLNKKINLLMNLKKYLNQMMNNYI